MSDNKGETRPDAPWDDEKAYAYIGRLFKSPEFLSVAQDRIGNHGDPFDLEKFSANFDNLMKRWNDKFPLQKTAG
jgi:hypothetical protein